MLDKVYKYDVDEENDDKIIALKLTFKELKYCSYPLSRIVWLNQSDNQENPNETIPNDLKDNIYKEGLNGQVGRVCWEHIRSHRGCGVGKEMRG